MKRYILYSQYSEENLSSRVKSSHTNSFPNLYNILFPILLLWFVLILQNNFCVIYFLLFLLT